MVHVDKCGVGSRTNVSKPIDMAYPPLVHDPEQLEPNDVLSWSKSVHDDKMGKKVLPGGE